MIDTQTLDRLKQIARECRVDIIKMITRAGSGHPGGSLSVIDLVVALFFHEMKSDPQNPNWMDRDRFILSKGHAVPALYAALAKRGAIANEELTTFRKIGSRLQGHPDRVLLPHVEASTGSLGQGLSIAQGIALGLKLQKKAARVFCVLDDSEIQEGQVWEAALSAPKLQLRNLVALIDHNQRQLDGRVEDISDLRPLADKWRAFNWAVHEVDGHDFDQVLEALAQARAEIDRPTLILANTTKGKGVSFMEGEFAWQGAAPSEEEANRAIAELGGQSL